MGSPDVQCATSRAFRRLPSASGLAVGSAAQILVLVLLCSSGCRRAGLVRMWALSLHTSPLRCDRIAGTMASLSFIKPCNARQFYFFQRKVKQIRFSRPTAERLTGTNCLRRIHLTVGKINHSRLSSSMSPARSMGPGAVRTQHPWTPFPGVSACRAQALLQ